MVSVVSSLELGTRYTHSGTYNTAFSAVLSDVFFCRFAKKPDSCYMLHIIKMQHRIIHTNRGKLFAMETKNLFKNYFRLLLTSSFIILLFYPFLHEIGHIASNAALGGKLVDVSLLPLPSVLFAQNDMTSAQTAIVGLSSTFLPLSAALAFRRRRPLLRYMRLTLLLTCAYNVILNIVYTVAFATGSPVENTDMTTVLYVAPNYFGALLFANIVFLTVIVIEIKKMKAISFLSKTISSVL